MVIFYSCNSNYVNQTMVSMLSVMQYHKEGVEFLVVGDQLSEVEKRRIQKLIKEKEQKQKQKYLIRFVEIEEIEGMKEIKRIEEIKRTKEMGWKESAISEGHPRSIYAKLFPEQLTDAKRILYLDSDVIANAAFFELFSMDLQGATIAGVQMPYSQEVLKRQGLKGKQFLCDGIVLIDVEQWKKRQLSKRAIEYISHCEGKPERMSESVINYICEGQILILPPRYHLMPQFLIFHSWELEKMHQIHEYYSEEEIEEARKNPVFIHFMRELYIRPWYQRSQNKRWNHPYCGLYERYQRKLSIASEGRKELSIRTKVLRNLYEKLPFLIFLQIFLLFHKD